VLSTGWPSGPRSDESGPARHTPRVSGLPDHVRLLLTGTPPRRIGFSPGPLTDLRKARHAAGLALRTRPLRLSLLEHDTSTMYFAEPTAFWINQRSRVCWAQRNLAPERADLVWVFTQDPLTAEVRAWLDAQLRRVRPGVRVLNPPGVYDAYHEPDCFPRLARAGVRVPRPVGPADVGVTPVVYKAVGEQAARKERCVYDGPRPGFRASVAHDSRGADGRYRRYRAFVLGDLVLPEDVLVADHWNASLRHLESNHPLRLARNVRTTKDARGGTTTRNRRRIGRTTAIRAAATAPDTTGGDTHVLRPWCFAVLG